MAIGSDVWLRSAEANIQLDGEVRVSKVGREYQPIGTLQAPRGSYTLKIGPVTRDFTVTRGEVRYIGTLDAGLDIEARHTVRSVRGEDIPVIASIEGTLYAPEAQAGEHPPAADLGDRPGLLPDHRVSRQRGHCHRPRQRAGDRPRLSLERPRQRAGAHPDPGPRRADRPDRDPAGHRHGRVGLPHPARRRLAARAQDLRHLQRRLLSRFQPDQHPQSRRGARVPVQQGVAAPERGRAHHPALRKRCGRFRSTPGTGTRSASTSCGSGSSRWPARC